jgi:MerR family mercuric resistance operon transcriptional regulator
VVAAAVAAAAKPSKKPGKLTIARAAEQAGVGVETIRFYERERLIPRPPSGYRIYPESTVRRIRFLRHCQELGFSLKEAAQLADDSQCATACRKVEAKLAELDRRIAALDQLRRHLRDALNRQGGDSCGVCETMRV